MKYHASIKVKLKPTVNDPQGKTIAQGLGRLGFESIESFRAGKFFEVWLDAADDASAQDAVRGMCEKLLANPVIELFEFEVEAVPAEVPAT